MPNGNGTVTYRAIVGTLSGILILIGGYLYTQMDGRIEKIEDATFRMELTLSRIEVKLEISNNEK